MLLHFPFPVFSFISSYIFGDKISGRSKAHCSHSDLTRHLFLWTSANENLCENINNKNPDSSRDHAAPISSWLYIKNPPQNFH